MKKFDDKIYIFEYTFDYDDKYIFCEIYPINCKKKIKQMAYLPELKFYLNKDLFQ